MMKRILALAGAGALLLSMAGPAFGFTLIKNKARVKNVVITKADTGGNSIGASNDDVNGGKIKTGDAGAGAAVFNDVNYNELGCDCLDDGCLIIKNKAKVKNVVITKANTGGNVIGAGDNVNGGRIKTGDAGAGAGVSNFVNTNIIGE